MNPVHSTTHSAGFSFYFFPFFFFPSLFLFSFSIFFPSKKICPLEVSGWEPRTHPSSRQAPGSRGRRLRLPARPAVRGPSLPVGKRKSQGHDFSLGPSHGERACLTVPHGTTFTRRGSVCSRPHAHRRQGATCPRGTSCQQCCPGPAVPACPRDSLRRHVLPGRFIPSTLTAGSCRQPDGAVTSPAARLQLVTLPVVLRTWLGIRMAVFPRADCLEAAPPSYTHRHLWVVLDTTVCPQCRGASPFPDPCSSFGFYPLVLCPRMFLMSS